MGRPGVSPFALDDGVVDHTHSCFARGLFNSAYQLVDRPPMGREHGDLPMPFAWIRRHDEYDQPVGIARGA